MLTDLCIKYTQVDVGFINDSNGKAKRAHLPIGSAGREADLPWKPLSE